VIDPKLHRIVVSATLKMEPDILRYVPATHEVWVTEEDPQKGQVEVLAFSTGDKISLSHVAEVNVSGGGGPESLVATALWVRSIANTYPSPASAEVVLPCQTAHDSWDLVSGSNKYTRPVCAAGTMTCFRSGAYTMSSKPMPFSPPGRETAETLIELSVFPAAPGSSSWARAVPIMASNVTNETRIGLSSSYSSFPNKGHRMGFAKHLVCADVHHGRLWLRSATTVL
jgi:hypothetical protein